MNWLDCWWFSNVGISDFGWIFWNGWIVWNWWFSNVHISDSSLVCFCVVFGMFLVYILSRK
jgi:hypothetical protein